MNVNIKFEENFIDGFYLGKVEDAYSHLFFRKFNRRPVFIVMKTNKLYVFGSHLITKFNSINNVKIDASYKIDGYNIVLSASERKRITSTPIITKPETKSELPIKEFKIYRTKDQNLALCDDTGMHDNARIAIIQDRIIIFNPYNDYKFDHHIEDWLLNYNVSINEILLNKGEKIVTPGYETIEFKKKGKSISNTIKDLKCKYATYKNFNT